MLFKLLLFITIYLVATIIKRMLIKAKLRKKILDEEEQTKRDFILKNLATERTYPNLKLLQTIDINDIKVKDEKLEYLSSIHLTDYDKIIIEKADTIIIENEKVKILIDFPITEPVAFIISKEPITLSLKDIIHIIYATYIYIYQTEAETSTIKEGYMSEKIKNRNTTNGEFGIWGYFLYDLYLEQIKIYRDTTDNYIVIYPVIGT